MIASVRQAVYLLIESTWTDVGHILAEEESDRFNWIKYLQSSGAGLSIPFAVCIWGQVVKSTRGAATEQVWEIPLTVVIVDDADKTAGERDDYFGTKLEGLWTAIQAYSGSAFHGWTQPSYDTNPLNQANSVLIEQNLPYICAMFSATLYAGVSP